MVGLPESAAMLADAVGLEPDDIEEQLEPVIAKERIETDYLVVEPDEVAGISQTSVVTVNGQERIELDLQMYVGASDPGDRVVIEGTPDVEVSVEGGLHGDVTTPAVVVNAVPRVRESEPGLATMLDLALPSCSSTTRS